MILDLDRLRDATSCGAIRSISSSSRSLSAPSMCRASSPAFRASSEHGSFPLAAVPAARHSPDLAAELEGEALRREIERKFAIDLSGRPTMITVRGHSDGKDGRIHTDSATKLITLLLYLNPVWDETGGRLRLLRRGDDLDDCAAEIAPVAGTMVAFRRSAASFHGHYPHRGERRVVQLNWVTEPAVVRREIARHRWSARLSP